MISLAFALSSLRFLLYAATHAAHLHIPLSYRPTEPCRFSLGRRAMSEAGRFPRSGTEIPILSQCFFTATSDTPRIFEILVYGESN